MMNDISKDEEQIPVLIVGGSVVGLSMALFLAWQGVPAMLVEKHQGTLIHPRASGFNERTMELFRQAGLEKEILAQETPPEQVGEMGLRVESLTGKVLDDNGATWQRGGNYSNPFASPTRTAMIGQHILEPIVLKRAIELGSDIRFGAEMVGFAQDDKGVHARLQEISSGKEYRVRAQYMIAADGNRSGIRQKLGIGSYGYGTLGQWVSILFRADLSEVLQGRRITLCFINNATLDGIIGQGKDHWSLFANIKAQSEQGKEQISQERCMELVYAAIGSTQMPVELISTLSWELAARVAERYQQGRVFLVGDAAHVMTTMGAFGANTGIADAHNLAWTLARVLKEQAHPELLSTYGQERQPVADLAVGVSTGLYAYRLAHIEQREAILHSAEQMMARVRGGAKERQATAFSVMQGYRYRSAAILTENEEDNVLFETEPSGSPGTRAPHIWLEHREKQISILDLYGKGYVLLTGPEGEKWYEMFTEDERVHSDIAIYTIGAGQEYSDNEGEFQRSYGISASGAVLVRPDGFIFWRAQRAYEYIDEIENNIVKNMHLS